MDRRERVRELAGRVGAGRTGRIVWTGIALFAAAVLLLSTSVQARERGNERAFAERRAAGKVRTALSQSLTARDLEKPILGPRLREVLILVRAKFLADPAIGRVRIWQPDGDLIFSTQERERLVDATGEEAGLILDAIEGRTTSVDAVERVAPGVRARPVRTEMLKTVTPIRVPNREAVLGAAQIDTFLSSIDEPAAEPWQTLRIVFGIVLLAALAMLVVAVRFRRDYP
ncbi:MAG: hypothetical protein WD739_01290 [Actinomycetota bacterium]